MPTDAVFKAKARRIANGLPPRFMDLFAGCGGLSLGFVTAGCELVASVEMDPFAAATHGANFAAMSLGTNTQAHHKPRDVTKETPGSIFADLGINGPVDAQIDLMVGGPPCQAFARIGRAKLRHEAHRRKQDDADTAFLVDGRVNLWRRYLHYVRETKPIALVLENVPDMLNHGGTNIAESVAEHLRKEGYRARYTLLNAAWFGVPQMRERMFLIGVHESLDTDPIFPAPTHFTTLPAGYESTRSSARKVINHVPGHEEHGHRWVMDPSLGQGLPATTTAEQALADLPKIHTIDRHNNVLVHGGKKDPAEPCAYTSTSPTTPWSTLMRQWPRFDARETTTGHVIRFLPRDFKFFKAMDEGWQYPDIHRFVEDKRQELLMARHNRGHPVDGRTTEGKEFHREWTIPYDVSKFANKWWKLYHDKPVRTLMAHLGKDSYSHIHYDSEQARTISVREAARLQSFPDGFKLIRSMNPAFKQIGNAVPSLLAYAIAMAIRDTIGCQHIKDIRCDLLKLDRRLITTTSGGINRCAS